MSNLKLGVGIAVACAAALSLPIPAALAADDDELEEVVVTGSYIKRDSFDSASPLTVLDQATIEASATANLGELIADQPYNYGTSFQTNTYAARPQVSNSSVANMRGLGTRATLNLIDGKRVIETNLVGSIPSVAIARMDILKDGASALYGTDAVAGVINVITRKNFSGVKTSFFFNESDARDDFQEQVYDIIAGSDTENGHITMAASFKRIGELQIIERPEFARSQWSKSGTGHPGTWSVPNRDPVTGVLDGTATRTPDPGCGVSNGPGGTDLAARFNYLSGELAGTTCRFHFGETWNYMNPSETVNFWMNYQYEFSDNLSNEFDVVFIRFETESRGSPQNPGGRVEEFPIFLGDHPGNPFRAFADTDGDGAIGDGERLYAQDADEDGVPDRGTADLNGDGVMDVLLSATPFDSTSGIAFNEDVDVIALRALGKIGLLPGGNQPSGLSGLRWDGANNGNATWEDTDWRITDTLTYSVPDSSWEIAGTLIYAEDYNTFTTKNSSQTALILGINGELDPDPDPSVLAQYWNPFASQALNCVDRICTDTGVATYQNSVAVLDAVHFNGRNLSDTEFSSLQVIGTGDLYELPAGMMQAAFGAEWRKVSFMSRQGPNENACDWHEGGCEFDWNASQDVESVFFELVVPALDSLEINLAGRYSDYGGGIGSDFNPKVSMLFQPIDMLSIRASYSESFTAPSLGAQFGSDNCGLQTMMDELTGDFEATFRVRCLSGNPNLTPETAEITSVGVSLMLFDRSLNIGLDYINYDFSDRIAETTGQQVIDQDLARFLSLGNSLTDAAAVAAWIGPGGGESSNIIRDSSGVLTRVLAGRINAQTMEHTAWDIYARYNLDTDSFGNFAFDVSATYAEEFSYDLGIGAAGQGDGAGSQNETIGEVPPVPEWRAVGSINWFMGGHSAMVRVRWIDEIDQDILYFGAYNPPTLDEMFYTDINYAYTFDSLIGDRSTKFEIGARNVLDEFPDPIFNLGGIESYLHDIRGRMIYVRINQDI